MSFCFVISSCLFRLVAFFLFSLSLFVCHSFFLFSLFVFVLFGLLIRLICIVYEANEDLLLIFPFIKIHCKSVSWTFLKHIFCFFFFYWIIRNRVQRERICIRHLGSWCCAQHCSSMFARSFNFMRMWPICESKGFLQIVAKIFGFG